MAALLAMLSVSDAKAQQATQPFHIPKRPLGEAIITLALQSGLSIGNGGVDFGQTAGNPIDGRYTPAQALDLLLAGTPFRFAFLGPDTVRILPADAPTPRREVAPADVENIVVEATKRPELARLAPASLLILQGSALRDADISLPAGLTREVAGLSATSLEPGRDKLFIRGLSDGAFSGRSQAVVGLYLDEARLTEDAPDPSLRLTDMNRVEILRGSQGTLYGASTLAGVIRLVTNKPQLDRTEGTIAVSAAAGQTGAPSGSVDAMVNLPILPDRLALRLVSYGADDGGYINDIRLHRNDINQLSTRGGRAAFRAQVSSDWTATLSLVGQRIDAADSPYSLDGLPPFTRANAEPEPRVDSLLLSDLTLNGHLDFGELTSSTAVSRRHMTDQYDATDAWAALTGLPNSPSLFGEARSIDTLTHETRIMSVPGGAVSWVGGAYLSVRDEDYSSSLDGMNAQHLPVTARRFARKDSAYEAAAFGEVTARLTPKIFLTAGLRLSLDILAASSLTYRTGVPGLVAASGSEDTVDMSPRVALNYQPDTATTLYASLARGYRPGGININAPRNAVDPNLPPLHADDSPTETRAFSPDELWTAELGAKLRRFDGRLELNGTVWISRWNNVQSDQTLPDGTLYIASIGNVIDPGMELDLTVRPVSHITLHASGYLSNPEISKRNVALVTSGAQLPAVPRHSFTLSARDDWRLNDMIDAYGSADYNFTGRSYLNYDPGAALPMGNYGTLNLQLGLVKNHWQTAFSIDNLLDTRANTLAFGNPFLLGHIGQITPLRPRTFRLEVRHSF
jgi:outer membrane receptor protein involved in Fe transport